MPLSVVVRDRAVYGDDVVVRATITFDNSYPTGGEPIAASDFGGALRQIDWIETPGVNTLGNRLVTWNRASSTLQLWTALGTQAANASDQSTIIVEAVVIGK